MANIERYLAEHRDVLLEGPGDGYPRLLAVATTPEDAEKIARALNQPRGAVEALEACLTVLHGDAALDSMAIAEIEVDVRAALYRLGHRDSGGQ